MGVITILILFSSTARHCAAADAEHMYSGHFFPFMLCSNGLQPFVASQRIHVQWDGTSVVIV